MYSKQAIHEQQHQMFWINSEAICFKLTSKLRNGRFKPSIKGTISNALFLYLANIKFEIHIKKILIFKKIKIAITIGNAFFLYSVNIKFEIHKKKNTDTQKYYNWSHFLCTVNKSYSNNITKCFVTTQKQFASS